WCWLSSKLRRHSKTKKRPRALFSCLAEALQLTLETWPEVRLDSSQHGLEALGVAGDDVALFEEFVLAGEVAHQAAGFLNQQHTGRHVPFGNTEFPEGVISTGGHIGQVHAGSASAANAGSVAHQAAEHAQVVFQMIELAVAERETGTQHCAFQALAAADA